MKMRTPAEGGLVARAAARDQGRAQPEARLTAIVTLPVASRVRPSLGSPGAGPLPAVAGRGGRRVARAALPGGSARLAEIVARRWRHSNVPPGVGLLPAKVGDARIR
jgi:hypothetical protein